MDWRSLIRDRRFQVGAAAAVALGGFVWWRQRKTGTDPAGTSDTATSTAGYRQAGTLDTTGTDVASWLGQYSGSLQDQLDAYAQSLQDIETHLGGLPTAGTPATPGTGGTMSTGAAPRRVGPAVIVSPAPRTRPRLPYRTG